ncbi:toll/interleukin-1 receptor domain-containing protein, partial [Pediococcus argentinicus]
FAMSNESVFLCFSSKDRDPYIHAVAYHLKSFGLSIWYDYDNLHLGNDRNKKNMIEPFKKSNYSVIFISNNLFNSKCAVEELNKIMSLKDKGMYIIPVFLDYLPQTLNPNLSWIVNLIYQEASKTDDAMNLTLKIVDAVLQNELGKLTDIDTSFNALIADISNSADWKLKSIATLLSDYQNIEESNVNAKSAMLYSIFSFLNVKKESKLIRIDKMAERIFSLTKLDIPVNEYHINIFENIVKTIIITMLNKTCQIL